ncbi:hypothetical protein HDV00_005403 [Rhizophlyctis rosea]|nr:hypothetical protein HDV00_005403 [Rhizophlyctis rosea]
MHNVFTTLVAAATLASTVSAHGFLYGAGSLSSDTKGTVRDIAKISYQIDDLRNPTTSGNFCRGAAKGAVTPISLKNGQDFTVTIAFSNGAQHVGDCWVYIVDANDQSKSTQIAGPVQCAIAPTAQTTTSKGSGASSQCPGDLPNGLVTNDMCLNKWTFKVQNADKITCKDCVLRWVWHATHNSVTNPEVYENCADVTVSSSGGTSSGSDSAPGNIKLTTTRVVNNPSPKTTTTTYKPATRTTNAPAPATTTRTRHHYYRVVQKVVRKKKSSTTTSSHSATKIVKTQPEPTTSTSSPSSSKQMYCGSDKSTFYQRLPDGTTFLHACAPGTKCQETAQSIICGWP